MISKPQNSQTPSKNSQAKSTSWRSWFVYLLCAASVIIEVALVVYLATARLGIAAMPITMITLMAVSVAHLIVVGLYVLFQSLKRGSARQNMWIPLGSVALAVTLWVLILAFARDFRDTTRREWKNRAIPEIATLAGDPDWVKQELRGLKRDKWWQSDDMLLMANDEWLVFRHEDSKRDWRIEDIFIAKGSNGKWYYSTFHFCINMTALHMCQDVQPSDLEYFVKEYRLEEFDGVSDDCLKKTAMFPYSMEAERNSQ